jgi:hypothetical protein
MFDLDDAVAGWRRNLEEVGVKRDEDLDELEGHLRDEIEELGRSGLPQEDAFHEATRRLGDARELNQEFSKVGDQRSRLLQLIEREVHLMNTTKNVARGSLVTTLLLFIGFSGLFGSLGATGWVVGSKLQGLSWQGVDRYFLSLGWLFLIYAVVGLALGVNRLRRVEGKRGFVLRSLIPAFLLCPAFAIVPVSYMVIAGVVIPFCMYVAVRSAICCGQVHFPSI